MARQRRFQYPGAVYHVMARGDGGKNVFEEDKDRYAWTDLLERAMEGGEGDGGSVGAQAYGAGEPQGGSSIGNGP